RELSASELLPCLVRVRTCSTSSRAESPCWRTSDSPSSAATRRTSARSAAPSSSASAGSEVTDTVGRLSARTGPVFQQRQSHFAAHDTRARQGGEDTEAPRRSIGGTTAWAQKSVYLLDRQDYASARAGVAGCTRRPAVRSLSGLRAHRIPVARPPLRAWSGTITNRDLTRSLFLRKIFPFSVIAARVD